MSNAQTTKQFQGFGSPNFTQVPDEAFDQLMPGLSGAEFKVLMYIIRRTYGFKKSADDISLKQMVEGIRTRDGRQLDSGTGLSKPSVTAAVKSLVEQGIITATRNQSAARGDEATTYQLRFQDPVLKNLTPPPSKEIQHPRVKFSYPQETVIQETVSTPTVLPVSESSLNPNGYLSKFRKGTADSFDEEERERTKPTPSSTGLRSLGALLSDIARSAPDIQSPSQPQASQILNKAPGRAAPIPEAPKTEAAPISDPTGKQRARRSRSAASPAEPSTASSEQRALVLAYMRDFAFELHDQANLKSTVTRALRLLTKSNCPQERWTEKLLEARTRTQERSAAIGFQGVDNARAGMTSSGLNKTPYFFSVLECVLGLHDHPAGQHPMPLSAQEFQSKRRKAAPTEKPERTSLAGKYAHLVQR